MSNRKNNFDNLIYKTAKNLTNKDKKLRKDIIDNSKEDNRDSLFIIDNADIVDESDVYYVEETRYENFEANNDDLNSNVRKNTEHAIQVKNVDRMTMKHKGVHGITDFETRLRGYQFANISINFILIFIFIQSVVYSCLNSTSCYEPIKSNINIGPNPMVFYDLGGCNANAIRNGESVRLYWSMFMHSGWLHLFLNVSAQAEYLYLIEPKWGALKCILIFFLSGLGGNLMSTVLDPCKTTVGSSGGLFGITGAFIPFCLEQIQSVPHPRIMMLITVIVMFVSLVTNLTKSTATWAHLGGIIVGVLMGFMMIAQLPHLGYYQSTRPHPLKTRFRVLNKFINDLIPVDWPIVLTFLRVSCLILLISYFVVFYSFLYKNYEYNPPGSLTFHGLIKCCCCYGYLNQAVTNSQARNLWMCYECDLNPFYTVANGFSSMTWESWCKSNAR